MAATIETQIRLVDNMSSVIRTINSNLTTLRSSLVSTQNQSTSTSRSTGDLPKNTKSAADNAAKLAANMAKVYVAARATKAVLEVSDKLSMINAKMGLIIDDETTVLELQNNIYEASQRSRTSYMDTANLVTRIGTNARDAFASNAEMVQFAENLNKVFLISGASAEEQRSATLQLTQSLGSGVLRGEELNAVFEVAPYLMQRIAESIGVPIGSIRKMASEGEITAEIVKNAMLGSSDTINEDFSKLPMTWSQLWTVTTNGILNALQPILIAISNMSSFIVDHWSVIASILKVVINLFAVFLVVLGVYLAMKSRTVALEAAHAIAVGVQAVAFAIWTAACTAAAFAQEAFNVALLACPITWVIILIVAIIAIIIVVIATLVKLTKATGSTLGVICGSVFVAGAAIYNTVTGLINGIMALIWSILDPIFGIVEWVLNVFNGGFESFGGAVANLIGQIISWFLSLGKVVTQIIDSIFGTDWTSGLSKIQEDVIAWGKTDDAVTIDRTTPQIERIAYGDAYNKGAEFGNGVTEKLENLYNGVSGGSDAYSVDPSAYTNPTLDTIADNTDDIKNALDITKSDLKYIRDYAENRAIDRYLKTEIKIDMTNNNQISKDADADAIFEGLRTKLEEELASGMEGVA